MELRQLRHFVAVAEEGNISRAAKRMFLTQPALSRQVKALEDEFGQCLLERQAHSIRLTPFGEALLHEARELLVHAEQVLERVRDPRSLAAGGAPEPSARPAVAHSPRPTWRASRCSLSAGASTRSTGI